MRKKLRIFLVLACLMLLAGCSGHSDFIRAQFDSNTLPNHKNISYEFNIGNKVQDATVTAELWKKGQCTSSEPLTLSGETEKLNVNIMYNWDDEENKNVNIQFDNDGMSSSLLTNFEIPNEASGYTFVSYADKEKVEVAPDKDVILAALAFDLNNGVESMDLTGLAENQDKINNYDCLLMIRASFTEK